MMQLHATLDKVREQRTYRIVTPEPLVISAEGAEIVAEYATLYLVDDRVFLVRAHGRRRADTEGRQRSVEVARWHIPDEIPAWVRILVLTAGYTWASPEVRHG